MSIYTGNDLQAPERYRESVEKARNDGATGRGNGGNTAIPFSRRLLNSSYSLNFISAAVEALGKRFFTDETDFRYSVRVEGETIPMNVLNADLDQVKSARRLRQGKADTAVWGDALLNFAAFAEQQDFRLIVSHIPSAHTAYATWVTFLLQRCGAERGSPECIVTCLSPSTRR